MVTQYTFCREISIMVYIVAAGLRTCLISIILDDFVFFPDLTNSNSNFFAVFFFQFNLFMFICSSLHWVRTVIVLNLLKRVYDKCQAFTTDKQYFICLLILFINPLAMRRDIFHQELQVRFLGVRTVNCAENETAQIDQCFVDQFVVAQDSNRKMYKGNIS